MIVGNFCKEKALVAFSDHCRCILSSQIIIHHRLHVWRQVHLVRVLSKVIRHLEQPQELDTYLRCIGRLHQLAGVDRSYLLMSGKSFCEALDSIEQHKELWSNQVLA